MPSRPLLLAIGLVLAASCGEPRPRRRAPARPDKADLFGDPALVPTREGERARRELARAGEIDRALRLVPEVERVSVDVQLPSSRVLVVLAASPGASRGQLETTSRRIVGTILGQDAASAAEIVVLVSEAEDEPAPPSWALLVTVLALGVSLGISFERGRRMLALARARSRRT